MLWIQQKYIDAPGLLLSKVTHYGKSVNLVRDRLVTEVYYREGYDVTEK